MQTLNIASWSIRTAQRRPVLFWVCTGVGAGGSLWLMQLFTLFSLNLAKEGHLPLGGYVSIVTQAGVSPSMGPTGPCGVDVRIGLRGRCFQPLPPRVEVDSMLWWSQLHPSLTSGAHTAAIGLNISQAPSAIAQDQWRLESSRPLWYGVGAELPW